MSAAIAGSEVAITVESMFSMNRAIATMSGTRRSWVMGVRKEPSYGRWIRPARDNPRRCGGSPGPDDRGHGIGISFTFFGT